MYTIHMQIQCLSDIMTITLWQNRPKLGTVTVFQMSQIPFYYYREWMEWMSHRKRKETKQQSDKVWPGNKLGCCLVSFHFLCDIHFVHSVEWSPCDNYRPVTIFWPCPEVVTISDNYCSCIVKDRSVFFICAIEVSIPKISYNHLEHLPVLLSILKVPQLLLQWLTLWKADTWSKVQVRCPLKEFGTVSKLRLSVARGQ